MPDLFNEDEMTGDGMTYMDVEEEARERAFSEAMDAEMAPSATVDYWVYGAALHAADELRERLAAAEQRATDAEARAERLHAALVAVADAQCDAEDVAEEALDVDATLTAPATQPDERTAAERAVIDAARPVLGMVRGTHSAFGQVIYVQALIDALSALDALDATDGAAKETT